MELIYSEGAYALRRMRDSVEDYQLLSRWLTDPRVLEFYEGRDHPFSLEQVLAKYAPRVLSEEGVTPCLMLYEQQPVGYLQFYPADLSEYSFLEAYGQQVFGLDLFIGEPHLWGSGLGTRYIRLLLAVLFDQCGADWVILDPHVENTRAIRAYQKCGFHILKRLERHEQHEGQWVDCWLMGVRWNEVK